MWKTPLLPLYGIHVTPHCAKNVTLGNQVHKLDYLEMENPRDNVVPVLGLLSFEQFSGNLGPFRVARESNEEVWSSIVPHIGHGILGPFVHVTRTTSKRRGENAKLTNILWIAIVVNGVTKMNVILCPQCFLVQSNECQTFGLDLCVHIDPVLI